jgi:hypothetical protein
VSRLLFVLATALVLGTALVVGGCQADSSPPQTSAPQGGAPQAAPAQIVWVKPGVAAQQTSVDRYECMQSSQQPVTRTAPDAKGTPVTVTTQATSVPLFNACMTTRGYYASRPPDPSVVGGPATQTALAARRQEFLKVCFNPAYALYYAKTACSPLDMTPAQRADPSRISPEEKAIFLQARHVYDTAQDAVMQVIREGSLRGQKVADIFFTTYRPQFDKADRDLYSGAITWGAYNTRLVEINRAFQGDLGQVSG